MHVVFSASCAPQVKASRLLSILMLLQARGRMTAPELARVLEVSVRTVLRDVDELSAAGVPLWSERGRNGGFQLREGWSTELTGMTEPESQALLLAGLPAAATDLGLGSAAVTARFKLVASLPPQWREGAARVGSRLHIDPVDWYRVHETPEHLRDVAQAVWQDRRIDVRYESWRGAATRTLEPLGLVFKAGAWYVAARMEGQLQVRTYRISNMLSLRVHKQRFRRPAGFELTKYWQESATRFETDISRLQAEISVSPRALAWLENERRPYALAADACATDVPKDWKTVLLPMESIEHGARRVLSFGPEVKVRGPVALQQQVLEHLNAVLDRYRADDGEVVSRRNKKKAPSRNRA